MCHNLYLSYKLIHIQGTCTSSENKNKKLMAMYTNSPKRGQDENHLDKIGIPL